MHTILIDTVFQENQNNRYARNLIHGNTEPVKAKQNKKKNFKCGRQLTNCKSPELRYKTVKLSQIDTQFELDRCITRETRDPSLLLFKMKYFIAIVLFATLASSKYVVKTGADLSTYRDECVKQLSVPEDLVTKYKTWVFPDDSVTHCYIECVMEKFGLFDKTTGYSVENVHEQIVKDKPADHNDAVHEKIAACADKNTQGSGTCEWAYRGAMCFMKENLPLVQKSVPCQDCSDKNCHEHDHASHEHASHEKASHEHSGHHHSSQCNNCCHNH